MANDTGSWRGFSRYGVPLTREEFAELESREARLAGAAPVIDAYARTVPAEWGGLYLDHEAGGVVVAQFTDHLSLHAARLRELVPGDNRIEVRQVRWSLEALNEHQQRIEAEIGWVASLDAEVTGIGIPVQRNVVELDISSALPDVEAEILEHFGQPEWLLVESDGVGRWDGPRGSLVVRAVGRGGAPIAGLWCVLLADDPAAAVDSTSNTDELGECRFEELGATSFTVEAKARSADDMAWVVLGRSRARVQAEGNSVVTLVVDTPPTTPDEPPATEGPPEGDGRAR